MSRKLGEIFDIPNDVHQGDFVLRLTEWLQADRRRQTLQQYVVTLQLVERFGRASRTPNERSLVLSSRICVDRPRAFRGASVSAVHLVLKDEPVVKMLRLWSHFE